MANILFTGTDFCDFVSYCPYVSKSKQIKILRIYRNEEDIKLLTERISLAIQYMKDRIDNIKNIQTIIK